MSRLENENRVYKVMFVRQKSGSFTPRLTVPATMLRDLNIHPGDRVKYIPVEGGFKVIKYEEEG